MNYYNEIKNQFINNEITKRVKDYSKNKSDLDTYYNVGKLLVEAQGGEERAKYGDKLIKEYSKRLTNELGKGYTETNLKYFRQFYYFLKSHTVCDELSWSHYRTLLSMSDDYEISYYISICKQQNLSVRKLQERIKSKEYERLPEETKNKLRTKEKSNMIDFIKNPIMIKNSNNYEIISEKILQELILEDIEMFMKELGDFFSFIGSEYKIKIGNSYNYIDLLLFNIEYNCFVVIELKVTELKKEHIGQIQVYMNYIDDNLKRINQDKTIGIIICKQDNKYIIKYCSDSRVVAREYELA
jgi:predicted nuclease of restriction endonuclease-like (RecB) superfamily